MENEWIDSNEQMPPDDDTVIVVKNMSSVFQGRTLNALHASDFLWKIFSLNTWGRAL